MSRTFSSRRYLLGAEATAEDVASASVRLGWPKLGEIPEDRADLVSREVIWGASRKLTLHYSEDFLSRSPHFFVTGDDPVKVNTVARFVENRLRPAILDELIEAYDNVSGSLPDEILATLRLGLGAPLDFDERFYDRVCKAMRSDHEELRRAAIWATVYVVWVEYLSALLETVERDPAEGLRSQARVAIQAYRSEGVGVD